MRRFFIPRLLKDKGYAPLENSLTGYTLLEVLLTITLLALVMVAMTPFVRVVHTSWNIADRKTELQQNGRSGLEMMSRYLRQAKRITGMPAAGSGDYVKFRNWQDNQTIIFYHNVPASPFYIGDTGLIKENDLVMRTIDSGGTNNALLAKSLNSFRIECKDNNGSLVNYPFQVDYMDASMNLVDPQGLIPDTVEIFSSIAVRPEVRITVGIDRSVWLTSGNNIIELSLDNWISGFSSPNAVSVNTTLLVNGHETVWVADTSGNRVRRIYWNGSVWTYDTITGFNNPRGISVNSNEVVNGRETCWVADTSGNRIRRIVWTGSAWSYSSGGGVSLTGFSGPRSVSVNTNELVNGRNTCWVADTGGNRVRKIYWNGSSYVFTSLSMGTGSNPYSVSVNSTDGFCWVANYGTGAANGRRIRRLYGPGTNPITWTIQVTGFSRPIAVSVDSSTGDCWVADPGNETVKKVSSMGTVLFTLTNFLNPQSVAADSTDHTCWVADTDNNQVVKLDADGDEEFRISGFQSPLDISSTP